MNLEIITYHINVKVCLMFEHLNPGVILRWKYERLQTSSFFLQNYTFYINFTDYLAIIRITHDLVKYQKHFIMFKEFWNDVKQNKISD